MSEQKISRRLLIPLLGFIASAWMSIPVAAEARASQCLALFIVPESVAQGDQRLEKLNRFFSSEKPRHIVVLPSQTLDAELAKGIKGLSYYELRAIWSLRFAFDPMTRVTYLTSIPVDPAFIDHLRQSAFARDPSWLDRVDFVQVPATHTSLSASLLWQKSLPKGLRLRADEETILMPFLTTPQESAVAAKLGLPLFSALAEQSHFGSKSQSKLIFKEAGVQALPSIENIKGREQLVSAIDQLWTDKNAQLSGAGGMRLMVKLNEGVSGLGNAILKLPPLTPGLDRRMEIEKALRDIQPVGAANEGEKFVGRMAESGGIAEVMLQAKSSPSGQALIYPDGRIEMLSTHEQILDAETKQIFLGAKFPADDPTHRQAISNAVLAVGRNLYQKGVVGFFAVDFVSDVQGRDLFAIEINLRQGGTTHARQMAEFALGAKFDPKSGFLVAGSRPVSYVSSDNVYLENLKGVETQKIVKALAAQGLLVSSRPGQGTGIMLTMAPLAKKIGKLGIIAYGHSAEEAQTLFENAKEVLAKVRK